MNPSLVLIQSRKTCTFIAERVLMGVKNQIKQKNLISHKTWRPGGVAYCGKGKIK